MPRVGFELAFEHATAAVLEPERWVEALRCAAELAQSPMGQLVGASPRFGVVFNWGSGVPIEVHGAFVEAGGGDPRRNPRAEATFTMPVFSTRAEADFITQQEISRSEFYNDFAHRFELDYVCMSRLATIGEIMPTLALIRPKRAGHYETQHRETLERLAPEFSRALRLQAMIEGRGSQIIVGAMDGVTCPAFVFDHAGKVRALSRAAEAFLQDRRLIESRGGRVRAIRGGCDARLQSALRRACERRLDEAAGVEDVVLIDSFAIPHVVQIAPLPWDAWSTGQGPCAMMTMRPLSRVRDATAVLRQARGLTKVEAVVALRLAQGVSATEIATERGVTVETVRNQIKRAMSKLTVHSQIGLAREIDRLAGPVEV